MVKNNTNVYINSINSQEKNRYILNDWKLQENSNIVLDNGRIIYNNSKKSEYIRYTKNVITLNRNKKSTKVEFSADVKGFLKVELHIIGYDKEHNKLCYNKIYPEETRNINIENCSTIELAINVKGSGDFKVRKICVGKVEYFNSRVNINHHKGYLDTEHINGELYPNKILDLGNTENITYNILTDSYKSDLRENKFEYIKVFEKNLVGNEKQYVDIVYSYKSDNKVKLSGLIKMIDNKKNTNLIQIYEENFIKIEENIVKMEGYIKIEKSGLFKDVKFILNKYKNKEKSKENLQRVGNTSKYKKIKDYNMAVIMDEFTTVAYENECNLIKITPRNWKKELIVNEVDLLFVESAWNGNNGNWTEKVGDYSDQNNKELFNLIKYCNDNKIPTVFWNKEDPVHFNRFINIAKRFDLILTTDKNCINNYEKVAGDKMIDVLQFAAQPQKNNPIKTYNKKIEKACFAGSYYIRHAERAKDTDLLLEEALVYGLDIYDRNYDINGRNGTKSYGFPKKFRSYIKGKLEYKDIDKAYKGYKLMVNLNTVKSSPTMFARRVFEGLACGTPIISNYSEGMVNTFGSLVHVVENKGDGREFIKKLKNEDLYIRKIQLDGIREVFEKHTYKHRLKFILDKLNLPYEDKDTSITLFALAKSKDDFQNIINIYERQTYKFKKLVIMLEKFDGYIDLYKKYNNEEIEVYIKSYMHNYEKISEFVNSDFISFISPNKFYGKNYIRDLVIATQYTNADIIGKSSIYTIKDKKLSLSNINNEYIYTSNLKSYSSIFKTNILENDKVDFIIQNIESLNIDSYYKKGKSVFSIDKYNFIDDSYGCINKEIISSVEI